MPKTNILPNRDELHRLLIYKPKTGKLVWKKRTVEMFAATENRDADHACAQWNSRWAGKEALTKMNVGYRCGRLNYQYVLAHRVIWKMMTGEDAGEIDHIDGDRSNNAWSNLRSVSSSLNRRNSVLRSNNTSGTPGVTYDKRRGCWQAGMNIGGKFIYLGSFDLKDEAIAVRKAKEKEYGFHSNHGRKSVPAS